MAKILTLENMGLNSTFWKNKTVLITGHSGFTGSWLSQWLIDLGASVHGISHPINDSPNLFKDSGLNEKCNNYFFDICDQKRLHSTLHDIQPHIIFHLAAQPIVLESYQSPVKTIETNVLGTSYLLEATRTCSSIECVLVVTSDKCYSQDTCTTKPFKENSPLGGTDPYSASKACQDIISAAFYQSFFKGSNIGFATIRAGNIIGGGDWANNRIIPDCFRAIQNKQPLILRHPNATRPWQYILDVLYGYLCLAENLSIAPEEFNGPWNFGPIQENTFTVHEVVDLFFQQFSSCPSISIHTHNHHEAELLSIDSRKAKEKLGWAPVYSINSSIKFTAEFYQSYSGIKEKNLISNAITQYTKTLVK